MNGSEDRRIRVLKPRLTYGRFMAPFVAPLAALLLAVPTPPVLASDSRAEVRPDNVSARDLFAETWEDVISQSRALETPARSTELIGPPISMEAAKAAAVKTPSGLIHPAGKSQIDERGVPFG